MSSFRKYSAKANRRIDYKRTVLLSVCLTLLILIFSVLRTSCLSFFGKSPALELVAVCAIGFICGGKFGASFGIFAGVAIDALGGVGVTLTPILYMLCGYMCGEAVGWFLSTNFLSFTVYAMIAGLVHETITVIKIALLSDSFNLWNIIKTLLIFDYLGYLVCIPIGFFAVKGINFLFKGKDTGAFKNYV